MQQQFEVVFMWYALVFDKKEKCILVINGNYVIKDYTCVMWFTELFIFMLVYILIIFLVFLTGYW